MGYGDLRELIEYLETERELIRIAREVNPVYEIAAGIRKTSDTRGPALLFEKVKGSDLPVLGGLYATRKRTLKAIKCPKEDFLTKFTRAINNPIPPRIVPDGPCQEIVYLGDEVDLTRLPICTHSEKDNGAYITIGIQIARDPEYGYNLSIHRCMLKGKNRLGVLAPPAQHLGMYYCRAEARGEALPMAIAIGVIPEIALASQIKSSIALDEMCCAGGLRDKPIELVKCKTIDLEVPATAEIIIEGKMPPQVRETEGPFGEYPGYYGGATNSPVLEVSAITMRKDPIYQAGLTGMPVTENHVLRSLAYECVLYDHIKKVCPTIKGVYITPGGASTNHAVIAIKQVYKDQAKQVIYRALTANLFLRHVVVVDEDINIYDMRDVEWAIAFRVHAPEDVLVLPSIRGFIGQHDPGPLDPAYATDWATGGIGIDATRPFGLPFAEVVEVPGAEEFELPTIL